jgi:DNA-binding beta-propeller fold protein YncE
VTDLAVAGTTDAGAIAHWLYAVSAGPDVSVYDIDSPTFALVKQVHAGTDTAEVRGAVASYDGMLYIAAGCASPQYCAGKLTKLDLLRDQVLWTVAVPQGIDSHAISPDGKTIYMPTGENDFAHTKWLVIQTSDGSVTGTIDSGIGAPHNTIVGNDGRHVYLDAVGQDSTGKSFLVVADAETQSVIQRIGPVLDNVTRPFTIDAAERFAFILPMGFTGFQVGDIATGQILFTVSPGNYTCPWMGLGQTITCNHGISLSPDGAELYTVDYYNNAIHIFDVTGLPTRMPTMKDTFVLVHPYTYSGAWATHSRDGRFVFVGRSGDVIDTRTRTLAGFVPALVGTKIYTEVDLQDGQVIFTPLSRSAVGYP